MINKQSCVTGYTFFTPILLFVSILQSPLALHAMTRVGHTDIQRDTTWQITGSPYIVDGYVDISRRATLTIEEGVEIIGENMYPDDEVGEYGSISVSGKLVVNGTKDKPVTIKSLGNIYASSAVVDMRHTKLRNIGFVIEKSTTTLERVSIDERNVLNDGVGIDIKASLLEIKDSYIGGQKIGIYSRVSGSTPFQVLDHRTAKMGVGGIGNALALGDVDQNQNVISIKNSTIDDNTLFDIKNDTNNVVNARQNWWGSIVGAGGDSSSVIKIVGLVDTGDPLTAPPVYDEATTTLCCSNVLFLPGLQSSRLIKKESIFGIGTTTNTLWEPNRNEDVKKLYMDVSGESIDPAIEVGDIVDKVFGYDIYDGYIDRMDDLVDRGYINSWLAHPYDWRLAVTGIGGGDDLIEKISQLASTSKTGMVNIVAHSNGGLVLKSLLKNIESKGKAQLIDKVIMVAVPELGTPKALASILHGYGQSIAKGIVLKQGTARSMSENMISALTLIPSDTYYSTGGEEAVTIDGVSLDRDEVIDYLKGDIYARVKPDENDIETANVISSSLIDKAKSIHKIIDILDSDISSKILSYVGFGNETVKAIEYIGGKMKPIFTKDGDGTVVTHSAIPIDNERKTRYIDMANISKDESQTVVHANMLSSETILDQIEMDITGTLYGKDGDEITSKYITENKPAYLDHSNNNEGTSNQVSIGIHSPVDIHLYDNEGNHTGPTYRGDIPSDFITYDEDVPGTMYDIVGESKYIRMFDMGTEDISEYELKLNGTGLGTFSISVSTSSGESILYKDIPVTPLLSANMSLIDDEGEITLPSMKIDYDSDGLMDREIRAGEKVTHDMYIEMIRKTVQGLSIEEQRKQKIYKKLEKIKSVLDKDKANATHRILSKVVALKDKLGSKNVTAQEREALIKSIELLVDHLSQI